ncbi:MAG: hypothetical protein JJE22_17100, partial [Bacteroidia bacterium]|nr:hypothetical protein [Bacteroidia bacterium]
MSLVCLWGYVSVIAQTREAYPVILKGSSIPCMAGTAPTSIVAFKFSGTNWIQIPVQIDEVVIKDIKAPYGPNNCLGQSDQNIAWNVSFYADANTFTGADTDPLFDNDDELVFMAKDAGSRTTTCNYPAGTLPNTLCELTVKDPLTNTVLGYVYLFKQNGTLNPSANISYVNYQFTYASNYMNTYDICSGNKNNENSTITTSRYFMRFTGKWIEEELKIIAGNSTGMDILDRHQAFVAIDNCFRTENTFSSAEGPVVTSKTGPIRAIRSVMGTNSGIFTQITILFTESRVDYVHNFRVHPIGGYYDVYDLNSNAIGMKYYNNQNQTGVTINGVQDIINTTNYNQWELYTGSQGSLAVSYDYNTDMTIGTLAQVQAGTVDAALDAYYDDAGSNAAHQCTGDGLSYGSSGFHLLSIKCTDRRRPDNGCGTVAKSFTGMRYHYLLPPNTTIADAIAYRSFALNPLIAATGSCPMCTVPSQPSAISGNNQPPLGIQSYSVTPVSGVSYNWTISGGGTITANGNTASINWTVQGLHAITITPFNGCGNGPAQTFNVNVQIPTGVTNLSGSENIFVSPNPVSGSLFIFNGSNRKLKYYQIISSSGMQIQSGNLAADNNTSIKLSACASGIYILVL